MSVGGVEHVPDDLLDVLLDVAGQSLDRLTVADQVIDDLRDIFWLHV